MCKCLGLSTYAGTTNHLVALDPGEKKRITRTLIQNQGVAFLGGAGFANAVSESGLYKVILRSEKATARPFQDWVTREVLPSIRKTGGYLLNEEMRPTAAADSRDRFPIPTAWAQALRMLADEAETRKEAE